MKKEILKMIPKLNDRTSECLQDVNLWKYLDIHSDMESMIATVDANEDLVKHISEKKEKIQNY